MVAVGFVYAPLAPLVPLFAAIAFSASLFVYKYQLMYVCVTKVETGGRLWRVAINRVLFALVSLLTLRAELIKTNRLECKRSCCSRWVCRRAGSTQSPCSPQLSSSASSRLSSRASSTRPSDGASPWFMPES